MKQTHQSLSVEAVVTGQTQGIVLNYPESLEFINKILSYFDDKRTQLGTDYQVNPQFDLEMTNTLGYVRKNFNLPALAAFSVLFFNTGAYHFMINVHNPVQLSFAKWLFNGEDGVAKELYSV